MTPEQERLFINDFKRCLPSILDGCDPAYDYPDGWLRGPEEVLRAPTILSPKYILDIIARVTCLTVNALKSERRSANIPKARFLAYYLIYSYCPNQTSVSIGFFMTKDHTTVLHGIKRARDLLEFDEEFINLHRIVLREIKR